MVYAFEEKVAPYLIQPTLVYGHPVEISPLAKPMQSDPRFAERFEIFIAGMECGDNWSEQNDPVALLDAWKRNYKPENIEEGEFHPLDYDFIETLEHGMPPTTGIGPGLERMAMIFTEQEDIYDVIFFPMMKPHISPVNRSIYGVPDDTPEAPAQAESPSPVAVTIEQFRTVLGTAAPDGVIEVLPRVRLVAGTAAGQVTVSGLIRGEVLLLAGGENVSSFAQSEVVEPLRARFPEIEVRLLPAAS
jgi:hypothetical protein